MAVNAASAGWSPDGNWFWDGQRWNDAISEDGKWRFDGAAWVPFTGARSAMPVPIPPPPSALAPSLPPPPVPGASGPMPSWVDPGEIDRLAREKAEREALAAQPVAPLPPQLDWRRAGEFIQYSKTPSRSFWRGGATRGSWILWLVLLWLCSPLALGYVWMTDWSIITKVYRTIISVVWSIALLRWFETHPPPGFG